MHSKVISRLGPRFADAFAYACEAHATQLRTGSEVPYVAHLMAVASLALEAGGDEDVAIAALLHDAAEDAGGEARLRDIGHRFGDRVQRIDRECSDCLVNDPKPAWRPRKEAYVASLETVSDDAVRVIASDKLHNLRTTIADMATDGKRSLDKFCASPAEQIWYFTEIAERLGRRDAAVRHMAGIRDAVNVLRQEFAHDAISRNGRPTLAAPKRIDGCGDNFCR